MELERESGGWDGGMVGGKIGRPWRGREKRYVQKRKGQRGIENTGVPSTGGTLETADGVGGDVQQEGKRHGKDGTNEGGGGTRREGESRKREKDFLIVKGGGCLTTQPTVGERGGEK